MFLFSRPPNFYLFIYARVCPCVCVCDSHKRSENAGGQPQTTDDERQTTTKNLADVTLNESPAG